MCTVCTPSSQSEIFHLLFQLDSLPRAELVKYIKRQAQLLQKSKARCNGQSLYTHYCLPFLSIARPA